MSIIERLEIESLIPHKGAMCLLDRVLAWGEENIHCTSMSHTRHDNPLLRDNKISAVHAIEYGAQAMAIHGGLLAKNKGQEIFAGYLVSVRKIKLKCLRLDDIKNDLDVFAKQFINNGGNLVYDFEVKTGQRMVVAGRVTVMQVES